MKWLFENSDELLESKVYSGLNDAWNHYCNWDMSSDIGNVISNESIPFTDEDRNRILDDAGRTYNLSYDDAVAGGNNIMSRERFGDKKRSHITTLADAYIGKLYDSLPVDQKRQIYEKAFRTAAELVSPKIAAAGDDEDVTKYSNMFKNAFAKEKYAATVAMCGNPVREYLNNIRKVRDNAVAEERKKHTRPQRLIASYSQQENEQLRDKIRAINDIANQAYRDAYAEARKAGLDTKQASSCAKKAGNVARRKAIADSDEAVKAHFKGYSNDFNRNKINAINDGFDSLPNTVKSRIQRLMDKAGEEAKLNAKAKGVTEYRKLTQIACTAKNKVKLNEVRKILQAKGQWPPPLHRLQGSDTDYLIPMKEGIDLLTASALLEGYMAVLKESGSPLYEGYTKSDMALGKYLKSLNGNAKIPNPAGGVAGETQHMYVTLARKPQAIATILNAFADVEGRIPTKEDCNKIEEGLRQYAGRSTFNQDNHARYIGNMVSNVSDRSVFAKAATEYERGNPENGFRILNSIPNFKLSEFIKDINNFNGLEHDDSGNMSMNPDVKMSHVMNKWLFHGTTLKSAIQIALHGFDRGNKVGELAYNYSEGTNGMKHDYSGDYLFAFDAEDLTDNKDDVASGKIYRSGKYGATKIMFKASGYKIYHAGDAENQVIFDYHEPTGCFLIMSRDDAPDVGMPAKKTNRDEWLDDYQVVGRGKDGKPQVLFSAELLKTCIRWVMKNGDRYSHLMFKWK